MHTRATHRPRRGLAIRDSVVLRPGSYSFTVGEDEPVITVRAEDAVIDCSGVVLCGAEEAADGRRGVGIRVIGSSRVRIVGLTTVGFQVGVHVLSSTDVTVEGVSATGTRTKSVNALDPDDPVNWIDLFDKAGWRLYGTGIWFERCQGGTIRDCVATDGQNGITLDKTDDAAVLGCDCSRNAGWGIHLDRASHCRVVSNLCASCARPGDQVQAAGIAINNGCHSNEIVSNDLPGCTHGILLTARYNEQSNGNLIASNDVSGAAHSAIQVAYCDGTRVLANHVRDARSGFYLAHLRGGCIRGNSIACCAQGGIVVDHGSGVEVVDNVVEGCRTGVVQAGSNGASKPPTDCRIAENVLRGNAVGIHLEAGRRTIVGPNRESGNATSLRVDEACIGTEVL